MGIRWSSLFGGDRTRSDNRCQREDKTVSSTDIALLELKVQRDALLEKKRHLERRAAEDKYRALKFMGQKRHDTALLALALRRDKLRLAEEADKHLLLVERITSNVETAMLNVHVIDTLVAGTNALRAIQSELSVDRVHQVIDEARKTQHVSYEMRGILENAGLDASNYDEEELGREIQSLQLIIDAQTCPTNTLTITHPALEYLVPINTSVTVNASTTLRDDDHSTQHYSIDNDKMKAPVSC
eukprot:GHVT01080164.1.p1 GENE.GHVT01080164.1~~GHVT01080164.1.p1  ORF type:complete len:243 (+),score=17.15 GHVT01080164.1:663-1391(+)